MPTLQPRPKLVSSRSRHVYDVIVVGGQLGGALTAALLAKRSYRVLLVEHDGLGIGYPHEGFILPYAPFVMPPLRAMPAVEDAFTELGLTTTVQRSVKPQVPPLQLVLPKHRLDLFLDDAKRMAELKREFGNSAATIEQNFKRILQAHESTAAFFRKPSHFPPVGLLERMKFKSEVRKNPALQTPVRIDGEDPATRLLLGLLPFIAYLSEAPPLAVNRTLSELLTHPHRYPGGREGLREILCKRLQDLGGDYLGPDQGQGSVVESLTFEGGKLVGLEVLESENVYRAGCMIAATDAGAVRRLIPDKKHHRNLSEALELISTKRYLFTLNWVLPADVLPKGMGELVIMDAEADLGPLLVQVTPARRAGGKVEEETLRTVCLAAAVPAGTRDLGEGHLQKLAERLAGHLERLLPFARPRLVASSAPYLDAHGVRGSRLLPHPLYLPETETFLGVTGLSPITPVKNLLLASREVLPGLGMEGELLAAVQAADWVQETLKKKDPLKR